MSSVQLAEPATPTPGGTLARNPVAQASRGSVAPLVLGSALLLVLMYAGFAHGAVNAATEARVQVVLAAVAALAGGAWLWSGTLRFAAPRLAYAAIGSLAAFAVWSGLSVLWSVAPDQTWLELNRAITYVVVLCLAVVLGASHRRSVELVATGFLLVSLLISLYGIGQKLLPGLHVPGVLDLNQTGPLPRLQEPLGYWNALGLFIAMGTPIALALAVDRRGSKRLRLAAIAAMEVMLLTIGLTYSRGGVLALALALVAGIALSGARLRALMWLAAVCLATVPPLLLAVTSHSLTTAGVGLAQRERAGGLLTAVVIASLLALILAAGKLIEGEQRIEVGPGAARRIGRGLASAAGALLVIGVLALAVSPRGLGGTVSHAWKSFTATRATSVYDPHRLLSADSENRWVWWKEAAGAFSDRPLLGWGAGSFGVVHLLYRRDNLSVRQPHSMPLQWLAETGAIGAALALAAFGLLLAVGVRAVRWRPPGPARLLAAGLLAGGVAYGIHALYDWDWDIPGVTLPALVMLGVLAGSPRPSRPERNQEPLGPFARLSALAGLTLVLSIFAVSATIPSLAASKAGSALVSAAATSADALAHAQASAALASTLDPLSDAGLRAEATIALHRHRRQLARQYLIEATRRNPTDLAAWASLTYLDLLLSHPRAGIRDAERVVALNPQGLNSGAFGVGVVPLLHLLETPPASSATSAALPQRPRNFKSGR